MRTVVETPTFQRQAEKIWLEDERLDFITWIAAHSLAGEVIPGAGGARKVRWRRRGAGKSGGARVIYYNLSMQEIVLLVAIYAKSARVNIIPAYIHKAT